MLQNIPPHNIYPITLTMNKSSIFFSALAGIVLSGIGLQAQTVATDPVGFVQPFATSPNMLANSDTQVSVPFTRPPEFVGATSAATASTLTVSGSPWTSGQFVYTAGTQPKTYFVLIGPHASTNPKEGRMFQITSNTTNQLTLSTGGDDLSSVAANTQILVLPYQTLNSIFPASDAGVSFIVSPNSINRQTQVFIPNYGGTGTNLPPAITYYYLNASPNIGWRQFGRPLTEDHGDDAMPNAGYFTVRNAAAGTTLTTLGSVLTKKATIPLFTKVGTAQDNFVSLIRPVDVQLNDLGLITSGAFTPSPSSVNRIDQLFVFDPAQVATNKQPSATYYYITQGANAGWRKFGQPATTDSGTDAIKAGSGFIIRKGATVGGASAFWTNAPTY